MAVYTDYLLISWTQGDDKPLGSHGLFFRESLYCPILWSDWVLYVLRT